MSKQSREKKVPLNQEVSGAMAAQLAAFRKKFRRDPNPNDPVFFDPDADTPQEMKPEGFTTAVLKAMRASGMAEDYIYAYQKTGLMPIEGFLHRHSKKNLDEFYAAMDEYDKLHP